MNKRIIIGIIVIVICAAAGIWYWLADGGKPYNYKLSDYVTVGEYKGLTYETPEEVTISSSDLETAIEEDLEEAATMQDTADGLVHKGDTVNIDYVGRVDGETFDGGSSEGAEIEIGNSGYIDGFDDGLIGAEVGETVVLDLTFPDDYSEDSLAGKDVEFTVTVNSAQASTSPELADYVDDETDYDSVKEYKAAKKAELKEEAEQTQIDNIKQELWQEVLDDSVVEKYPDKELQEYVDSGIEMAKTYAESYDTDYETLIESSMGMTVKEYKKELKSQGKTSVKEQMVLYSIARTEGLKVTAADYRERFEQMAEENGVDEDSLDETMISSYGEDYKDSLKESFLWEDVMQLIYDEAKAE